MTTTGAIIWIVGMAVSTAICGAAIAGALYYYIPRLWAKAEKAIQRHIGKHW